MPNYFGFYGYTTNSIIANKKLSFNTTNKNASYNLVQEAMERERVTPLTIPYSGLRANLESVVVLNFKIV